MSQNRTEPVITEQVARDIYNILAAYAGATDYRRENFVHVQSRGECSEYRFIGNLGSGGKFWRNDDRWYVNAYFEDMGGPSARDIIIEGTNVALAALRASLVVA
jgi:hypothetical protein